MASDQLVTQSRPAEDKDVRPHRACDACRHRKIRCYSDDGSDSINGSCSNCSTFGLSCSYLKPINKRGPKPMTLEQLKKENASLKAKLRSRPRPVCSLCARQLQSQPKRTDHPTNDSDSHDRNSTPDTSSSDSSEIPDELRSKGHGHSRQPSSQLTKLNEYFGPASGLAWYSQMKEEYLGQPSLSECRRPLFWDLLPWEKETYNRRQRYAFPPSDLIGSLLHLYFAHVHPILPILHRPSFMRSVAEGLHTENMAFGGTLLSVLAVASRFSDDPRVFVDGESSLSAGWKFYEQVLIPRKFFEPTIHEVQMYLLLSFYASGTSVPQTSWLYLGLGVRCLQRRSDYRRKLDDHKPSPNDELWKRAFWTFVIFDRTTSAFLGQPMGMQLDDYDVEFPLEVDDEYWDQGLTQPPGKISQLSYFNCHIRVCEILGDASRRLYGSKKSRILMGWDGPDWEQRAVAELDSTMNDFLDSIPPHLKWDPENPPQGPFFDQSVTLHVSYNYILIAIHRPYIQKMTTLAAPSLFICARAARAIIHTAYIWLKTQQRLPQPCLTIPVFVSGVVLVLCVLGAKRSGLSANQEKDLAHIVTAMDILKVAESRLQSAGRLWEILRELCSLDGALPRNSSTNHELDSVPVPASPTTITASSVSYPAEEHLPQPPQPLALEQNNTTLLASDQSSGPRPGMSIEQLLADADPLDSMGSILDDEFMSMWMAAPTDVSNIGHWDAYIENRNDN